MPRFTKSKDGKERTTLILKVRLTRIEWEVLVRHCKELGDGFSPRYSAESWAALAIENEVWEAAHSYGVDLDA